MAVETLADNLIILLARLWALLVGTLEARHVLLVHASRVGVVGDGVFLESVSWEVLDVNSSVVVAIGTKIVGLLSFPLDLENLESTLRALKILLDYRPILRYPMPLVTLPTFQKSS